MSETKPIRRTVKAAGRGVIDDRTSAIQDRIEPAADQFKEEAAELIEELATRVRQLGHKFDRTRKAHSVARRLERTADYLRYRSSGDVVEDGWQAVTESRALWIAGGILGGFLAYRMTRSILSKDND